MNKNIFTLLGTLFIVGGIIFFINNERAPAETPVPVATTVLPYGEVTLSVGQKAVFKDNTIRLIRVFDDSRCPLGVTCIWAGTVKVEIQSVSGLGTSTKIIELGKTMTTEAEEITVTKVVSTPEEGQVIDPTNYVVSFDVKKKIAATTPTPTKGACFVGGCSSEICSDREDIASNCMYQESYACFKTAKCERQTTGECGWTQTTQLKACLSKF